MAEPQSAIVQPVNVNFALDSLPSISTSPDLAQQDDLFLKPNGGLKRPREEMLADEARGCAADVLIFQCTPLNLSIHNNLFFRGADNKEDDEEEIDIAAALLAHPSATLTDEEGTGTSRSREEEEDLDDTDPLQRRSSFSAPQQGVLNSSCLLWSLRDSV